VHGLHHKLILWKKKSLVETFHKIQSCEERFSSKPRTWQQWWCMTVTPTLRNFSGCSKIEILEFQSLCGFTILEELGFSVFCYGTFFPLHSWFWELQLLHKHNNEISIHLINGNFQFCGEFLVEGLRKVCSHFPLPIWRSWDSLLLWNFISSWFWDFCSFLHKHTTKLPCIWSMAVCSFVVRFY